MNSLSQIKKAIATKADPKRAKASQWFFKTGPGQYGEGDKFVGLTVPDQRKIAKNFFRDLSLKDIIALLNSKIHEHRFVALEVLVMKFEQANKKEQKQIANFYLKHAQKINNWDLVDTSAPYILGEYLLTQPKNFSKMVLDKLSRSKNLWEKRIAMVATAAFIREGQFDWTLRLAKLYLNDSHDLIHKAMGWMLREVGKKNQNVLEKFLQELATKMPRTALRYSIERLPEKKRLYYLHKS